MKIRKLPSGNYNARVEIPAADGKRRWKSITAPDRATVRKLASEYEQKAKHGAPTTLSEALTRYLNAKKAVLSPYTIKGYQNIICKIKDANLGEICADMSRSDAQKIVSAFSGMSQKTIRNRMGLISAAVRFAGYNLPPVTLPQKKHPDIHIPDEKILSRIMEAAREKGLEVPIALGVMGMRRSEICALTLDDLDGSVLHVRKAVVYGPDKQLHEKLTKNYMSDRYVRIPDAIAAKIREQGYVTDQTPAALSHAFDRLLEANGLPHYRLHDLRHFCASYCHNILHMSDAQIQAITGHKTSVVLREHYLHSMRDDATAKRVANRLANLM